MASIKRTEFELPAAAKDEQGQPKHFGIRGGFQPEITVRDGKAFITIIEHTSPNIKDRFGGYFIIVADGEEFDESRSHPGGMMCSIYFTKYVASFTLNGTVYHLVGSTSD
jgi:hypothetical protein